MTRVHLLPAVLPIGATVYFVRERGRSGDGRMFFSLPIARAWAAEQTVLTGAQFDIFERLCAA